MKRLAQYFLCATRYSKYISKHISRQCVSVLC